MNDLVSHEFIWSESANENFLLLMLRFGSGIYNLRETEMIGDAGRSAHRTLHCTVHFLDGSQHDFELEKHALGQDLLNLSFEYLELLEKDYFGLQFTDLMPGPDSMRWLEPTKSIRKQMQCPPYILHFRVKFYVSDPSKLLEEYTRYHFYLQLRKDILDGHLVCPEPSLALLASYAVQSEFGDHSSEEHGDNYLSSFRFISKQSATFLQKVADLHKQHRGQTPADAEFNFLDHAKRLDTYGVELYHAKDGNLAEVQLGVGAFGVGLFQQTVRANTYPWSKIVKISFKRKQFFLQLKPEPKSADAVLSFTLSSTLTSKLLWKSCIEHHTFFRLVSPPAPVSKPLFAFGSRFRYSGRTEYQTLEEMKRRTRMQRPFTRFNSNGCFARSTICGGSTTYGRCKEAANFVGSPSTSGTNVHNSSAPSTSASFKHANSTVDGTPANGPCELIPSSAANSNGFEKQLPSSCKQQTDSLVRKMPLETTFGLGGTTVEIIDQSFDFPSTSAQQRSSASLGLSSSHFSTGTTVHHHRLFQSRIQDQGNAKVTFRRGACLNRFSPQCTLSGPTTISGAYHHHHHHPHHQQQQQQQTVCASCVGGMCASFGQRCVTVGRSTTSLLSSPGHHSVRSTNGGGVGGGGSASTLNNGTNAVANFQPGNDEALVTIRMRPDPQGRFGFNVKGGCDQNYPIIVSRVIPDSPADTCFPRLNEGDQVVAINGVEVSHCTHEQVVRYIRACKESVSQELVLVVRPNAYIGEDIEEPDLQYVPLTPHVADCVPRPDILHQSLLLLKDSLASGSAIVNFEKLYRKSPSMSINVALCAENVAKNRYQDISPYDKTRVIIKNGQNGDYINASFINMEIPSSGIVNRYIAAQGPLPHTTDDFWQVVWEQLCTTIVMLTATVERGRIKCHQYWPKLFETQRYGRLQVTCVRETETAVGRTREFSVVNTESNEERSVTHMQYSAWPDHGVPDDSKELIDFVVEVRQTRTGMVEPVIVHCSAGIGRTGVLILLETSMCLIEASEPIYPLEIVRNMRDQRAMLIQTAGQYKFACDAILKIYNEGIVKPLAEYQQQKQ
ncbi:Tyrosine-protein phosphatase 1 [Trichinella zimbabwensis]|uniref:protein-tyrosine-phosphatase n=1 Tax=Trichinella zimbabwensis TaxID=268475 RepID=A0A0V1HJX0_9BILA|nr:Tyrosine-protein phosphatase 1 [Trichinella zimbabwensis]